jgi:hypothetical protein
MALGQGPLKHMAFAPKTEMAALSARMALLPARCDRSVSLKAPGAPVRARRIRAAFKNQMELFPLALTRRT